MPSSALSSTAVGARCSCPRRSIRKATPYSTTTFMITDSTWPNLDRWIIIKEPEPGVGQFYAFFDSCDDLTGARALPPSYPSSQVPTNTPINTLDNNPQYRNSFYWGRQ